jgi:hypothetical protein
MNILDVLPGEQAPHRHELERMLPLSKRRERDPLRR